MKIKSVLKVGLIISVAFISACGGGGSGHSQQLTPINNQSSSSGALIKEGEFRPAVESSIYASVLVDCTSIIQDHPKKMCKLSELPFIGQQLHSPTKADVLAQTVVSHPWMATRFSQLLDKMPKDMLQLFRGVTAVVIGADIRPSHYNPDTGAIYLDPEGLWLNDAERTTISTDADFRSEFGNELSFRTTWRYVKGNSDAWNYYSLTSSGVTRTINDIVMPMADLLFHELAHANDFMPPLLLASINPARTASEQLLANESSLISSDLTHRLPLNSSMQFALADVMFSGVKATANQKQLTAAQVGVDFEIDGANDSYNYTSQYEDVAMLFEEVMMKYHYKTDRDIAFTDAPTSSGGLCNEYIVRWGVRNRIANPLVQSRAKLIVQQVLGINDASTYFTNVGAIKNLSLGIDWCSNLVAFSHPDKAVAQKIANKLIPADNLLPHH
jgi:hypothetical protein